MGSGKTSAGILINEVMYDPSLNDNYYEWIELYNPTNESINLSTWILTDNSENESIEGDFDHGNGTTIIPPKGYAIITDHGTKFYENFSVPNETIKLYVDDSSIGNGLGNNGDKLILKNETNATDAIEWIIDYEDVPGAPADSVSEDHSLSRYPDTDTNNSSADFYEASNPTPGAENKIELKPSFDIDLYPKFVPKVENDSLYGNPFGVKIKINNYPENQSYQLKSYVIGNESSTLPASQTWNGTAWEYSTYYTSIITTDNSGNWSGWQYLRFKEDYKEYQENIKENDSAILKVKIKNENSSEELSENLLLLDMDDSTSNGTTGGYAIGTAIYNNTFLESKIVIIENESGVTTGAYLTEDNKIDDELASIPGYFKLTSLVGENFIIKVLDESSNIIKIISNVTIGQGNYKIDIDSAENSFLVRKNQGLDVPLIVKNTGDFNDTIKVNITEVTAGWNATLDKEVINLNYKEESRINLHIAQGVQDCINGNATVFVVSEADPGSTDRIRIYFEILAPDLTVKNVEIYNQADEKTTIFWQGEEIKIKASVKNLGNEDATNASVNFYYDYIDDVHLIGCKNYEQIGQAQKYPSVIWDTESIQPDRHTIFVIVDKEEKIDELCESNNQASAYTNIYNTYLSKTEKEVIITELFYNTHPGVDNEFIAIFNPASEALDVSGWYITNNPSKNKATQTKIVFPNDTIIPPKTRLCITENASDYLWETGKAPDFEYNVDSKLYVPQMMPSKNFSLGNKGGAVALKDRYNHTVDVIVYGNSDYNLSGWDSFPALDSGNGIVIKRNIDENGSFIDTNTSNDWINPRRYGVGQSDFFCESISFSGEVKTFVSPDSSFETISNEIRNATDSLYLNIYEFTNPFLCDELVAALLRNVSVNILLESSPIGGITDEEKFILNRISNYGGDLRFIVNDKEKNVYKRYTYDHAKYLIIDNKTIIVESCNWAKSGVPKDQSYGNREWGIVVKNQSVAECFLNVFLDDWNVNRCDIYNFTQMNLVVPSNFYMDKNVYKGSYEPKFKSETFIGNFSVKPVFSPDNSLEAICDMIDSARESIYIEQLYIYRNWSSKINPFVERLVNKSKNGVDVKVVLNYNLYYEDTNEKINLTKKYFEENGIETKFIYSNWSYFSNVHNKGMIVDNKSVLISSINWNENSVMNNREAGIIIENPDVAKYYTNVFFYDWGLSEPEPQTQNKETSLTDYKNTIYIMIIFTMTFAIIARDWRKRQWT